MSANPNTTSERTPSPVMRPLRPIATETLPAPPKPPAEGEKTQTSVRISFPPGRMLFTAVLTPEWHHVRKIREQLTPLLKDLSASQDYADRCAMSASEMLENAVKYSLPEKLVRMQLDLSIADLGIEIIVENEAPSDNIEELRRILDHVNSGPAFETYLLLLREAATVEGIQSQVGLGRIRTEGYSGIDYQIDGNLVRIRIVPEKTVQEEAETSVIYGRRRSDIPSRRKAQFFVTVFHWLAVGLITFSLVTGARISWGTETSLLSGWNLTMFNWSPQGRTVLWHLWSAWALASVCVGYAVYLRRTGESRRVRMTRSDWTNVKDAIRKRRFWTNKYALWSANVMTYWVAYTFVGLLFGTGIALYLLDLRATTLFGGYTIARLIHAVIAYAIIPYALWHTLIEWRFGILWSIFKMGIYRKRMIAGAIGTVIGAGLIAGCFFLVRMPEKLHVARIPDGMAPPVLDGNPSDAVWERAREGSVVTVKGRNFPDSAVVIHVKGVHDGNKVFFRLRWKDPGQSLKRYPLQKTETGWKVAGTGFDANDEMIWYEDKISLLVTDVPNGSCEDTCHLGKHPTGHDKPVTWGLHYTEDGSYRDVWHWKAIRTDPMGERLGEPGWSDDMFFGPPVKPDYVNEKRYSAGYYADPQEGGGYRYNHKKADADKPLYATTVVPQFLPPKLETMGDGTRPHGHDLGVWWIHDGEGIPYDAAKDDLPVGTLIPNIIISPFRGDRASVRAKGEWKDGEWVVEMSRELDTGSKYDVAFKMERPVYMSIAAYQQVQTRHSEHYEPFEVVLDP